MAIEHGLSRRLLRLGLALLAVAFPPIARAGTAPNVLLIIADDYGWADVGTNNPDSFYDTPALDALAASGANFVHGYAASPVCSPTRASIMTGLYPSRGHMTEWFSNGPARSMRFLSADRASALPNQAVTIAEHLRAAGYQTFFAGKWHLGDAGRHLPTFQGFDVNIAGSGKGNPGHDGFFAPYQPFIGLDAPDGEHLPARLTDETIRYLESRDAERPFLAVLSYYSVHTPLQGRDDLVQKYEARRDALGLTDEQRFGDEEQVWPDRGATRPVRVRQDHAVYGAMVEAMDEHIGRLLGAIDRLGLRDDTVVIFVSDNGGLSTSEGSPTANLPLRGGKGWLYEGGIRVPLIARWPGVLDDGRAIETPAITNDILPTVLDAAGLPAHATDGVSFRTLAADAAPARQLFFHYPHYGNQGGFPGGAMIDWPWKFVQRYEHGRTHLYHLDADVGERTDLADTMPSRVAEMRAALEAWLATQDARFLSARPGGPEPWRPAYLTEPTPEPEPEPAPANDPEPAAAPVPRSVNGIAHPVMTLDGEWTITAGEQRGAIEVPGQWVQQGYTVPEGGEAEYTRTFELPAAWDGLGVRLRFESVFTEARVEVNGREVGRHAGAFVAFEFDITDHVRPGQNTLVVRVKGAGTETDLLASTSQYAVHDLGGITRPVTLYAVPRGALLHRLAMACEVEKDHRAAKVRLSAHVAGSAPGTRVDVALYRDHGVRVAQASGVTNTEGVAELSMHIYGPALWTHETPTLHDLAVSVTSESGSGAYETRVGLREITVVGRELLVNHRPVVLRGINRHVVDPYRGRVVSPELARRDAELLRDANVNLVRTSHYPPSGAFVEACDELGIMVEIEAPFCWVGKYDGARKNWKEGRWDATDRGRWYDTFERLNLQTVAFHQLSPSVVIWSLANESLWSPLWADVEDVVKAYDPTRATIFHDPPGVGVDNDASRPDLQNLHYPGPNFPSLVSTASAPVFLGEFCHLSSYNRREMLTDPGVRDRWGRGFARNWERVLDTPGVIGGAIWSGIDDYFYLPNGLTVGYGAWGPIDSYRRAKPEHWHVKKTYSPLRLRESSPGRLIIENRHAFTDLADIRFEWTQSTRRGALNVSAAPGESAEIALPAEADPERGPVEVVCIDQRGFLLDRFVIDRSPRETLHTTTTEPEPVRVTLDDGWHRVRRGEVEFGVHARTGAFDGIRWAGRSILGPGLALMLVPLNGEGGIQLTGDNQVIEPFNPIATGWQNFAVDIEQRSDGGHTVRIAGAYAEATGEFRIGMPPAGPILVEYDFELTQAMNPREWGVRLSAAQGGEVLRWVRDGLWSAYPDTHIGRTRGEAPLRGSSVSRGDWPQHPWALDDSPLGSNDFRSSKHMIHSAQMTDAEGFGMRVISEGDDTSRSWLDEGTVRWLIAGFSNAGNEPFFRPHAALEDRPLQAGDRITGSFELMPVIPSGG